MSAPDPIEQGIYNQLWGAGPNPPPGAPPQAPADARIMYQGADHAEFPWAQLPNGGWWAWDMRGPTLTLAWDLLRFRPVSDGAAVAADLKNNPTKPHGLFDYIVYLAYKANGGQ